MGVFRVKNHDFTQKNLIFSNFRGARAGCAPLESAPAHTYTTTYRNKTVNVDKCKHIFTVWELPIKSVFEHYKHAYTSSID